MTFFLTISAWLTSAKFLTIIFVALAVLCGQLSVGWCNDYVDAKKDSSISRMQKPLVNGTLDRASLRLPISIALVMLLPLSIIAAGWIGGLAHILAVASAQSYNFLFSRTVWSWFPYAVSFSLLPLFISQAASLATWPEPTTIALFVLVGVIAHLVNAIPDIKIDAKAGIGGLAVSLGRRKSLALTGVLALVALPLLVNLVT